MAHDDLPPGYTTDPIAPLKHAPKDFPANELEPGEYGEADMDSPGLAKNARAVEAAPRDPQAFEDAPQPDLPKVDERPIGNANEFDAATKRAEKRSPMGMGEAMVDAALQPDLANTPGRETAERFWVGTLPGAPVQNIDLGGVDFPLFTENVTLIAGATTRIRNNGQVVDLTPTQLERIRSALKRKVVRWRDHKKRRGYLVSIPSEEEAAAMKKRGRYRPFTAQEMDEPVGRYVYIVRGGRTSDTEYPRSVVPAT